MTSGDGHPTGRPPDATREGGGVAFTRRARQEASATARQLPQVDLAGLIDAARSVNETGGLDDALEVILQQAIRLLSADEASVMLLNRDRRTLQVAAAIGLPPEVVANAEVVLGEGISGYVAASGTPLLLDSTSKVERYADDRGRQSRLRSALCVPLRSRGSVEGVLNVNLVSGKRARDEFDARDLDLATLFGEFAASAVHNAQLYHQARRRGDDMARLFEASHALSEAMGVEEVADRILDAVAELVDSTGGLLCVVPEGRGGLEIAGYRDVPRGRIVAAMRRDGFKELLRATSVRVIGNVAADPVLAPLAGRDEDRSAVIAPLVADDTLRGELIALTRPGGPDDAQLRLLTTYINHAAMALTKALLFRGVRTKEDELTSLANSVPDPIVIVDDIGRFLAINPAAGEQFGLNPTFNVGAPVAGKLRSPELEQLLRGEEGGRANVTLFSPHPRTFRARVTSVRPDHGPAGARILTLEDVTTEREMEQLKADFVAVIGHELRTPLTMIKGYSSSLAHRGDTMPQDGRQRALEAISTHARRLERLIEDLLLVSRVEHHRPPLHLERNDLRTVVDRVVGLVQAGHPDRTIAVEAPGVPIVFPLDSVKIEQVIGHLLDNALKFSENDTAVRVVLALEGDRVEVQVVDEGMGIFSGDLPHLFERFHQVDGSATRAHGGTGIGLYICRTLVETHGGRIGVRSALGRGSTFWFTLPLTPPAEGDAETAGEERRVSIEVGAPLRRETTDAREGTDEPAPWRPEAPADDEDAVEVEDATSEPATSRIDDLIGEDTDAGEEPEIWTFRPDGG